MRFRRALELPCPGVAGGGAPSCPPTILAFWPVKWRHLVALEQCRERCHQHAAFEPYVRQIYVSVPEPLVNMNIEGNVRSPTVASPVMILSPK